MNALFVEIVSSYEEIRKAKIAFRPCLYHHHIPVVGGTMGVSGVYSVKVADFHNANSKSHVLYQSILPVIAHLTFALGGMMPK